MLDPTKSATCPTCDGEGHITTRCPFDFDVETDCSECTIPCGTEQCTTCDGRGEVDKSLADELGKIADYGR